MQARFLLGPAGSGKTFRCLQGVREALQAPEGDELIFLAPKQATFQLERQLLGWGERPREPKQNFIAGSSAASPHPIQGFSRLHILSFDRLARFIFQNLNVAPPDLLSDEGRIMVLRALLSRHDKELKRFGQSARRPGFARQLGQLLRELQQHQLTPPALRALAAKKNVRPELRDKLNDLALLHEKYSGWLVENRLQDGNCLLDMATEALNRSAKGEVGRTNRNSDKQKEISPFSLRISHLFMDGFAEMTPQELDLLAAVVPFCDEAVLAFCLEDEPRPGTSWLSIWNSVGNTFAQCRQRLERLPGVQIEVEIFPRDPEKSRFARGGELAALEAKWSQPHQNSALRTPHSALSLTACADPEAETVFAAREILKFVRQGNRFRDCAVIVRNLDGYHKSLARTFRRYGVPFFLDRRESVVHHPLAELTRSALRTVAFDWRHDDWFAALKAGFGPVAENEIDALENAALASGWQGKKWREPLPEESVERLRKTVIPPFENLFQQLAKLKFQPDGKQLAGMLRRLWDDLGVAATLEQWNADQPDAAAVHSTVHGQMELWLENLELGFSKQTLSLRDWLPVLESGLAQLTVGVIPPVLDEVLVGAIDRARNPDLKFALVLGVNETVFPVVPPSPVILTEAERDELQIPLGPDLREQLARERFYGYLAFTRASDRLAITFSRHDVDGRLLNPSPFIAHLQRLFPALEVEESRDEIGLAEVEHANELICKIVRPDGPHPSPLPSDGRGGAVQHFKVNPQPLSAGQSSRVRGTAESCSLSRPTGEGALLEIPALSKIAEELRRLREPDPAENLSPAMAAKLYRTALRTSVSRLEEFASCPYRFFVRSGLRAEERKRFELDARERGSFQHDVLKTFHEQVIGEGKRWRDLTPENARERIGTIAKGLTENFRSGLLSETAQSRFAARAMTESLQDFIAVTVDWLRGQNEFDPVAAELDFGSKESPGTAWEIALPEGRTLALQGRIDRVDVCRMGKDEAWVLVLDYKAGGKKLDALFVEHGVQLQLLAYLNVLRHWKDPRPIFGVDRLVPAGVFYVNLRGQFESGGTRDDVLADPAEARRDAYRHNGRFDAGILEKLDRVQARDQFNYRLTGAGKLYANSVEALPHDEFQKLLGRVERQLRGFGEAIFAGVAAVSPYRKGKQTPCGFCDYRPACRIDPWTHEFRVLKPDEAQTKEIKQE